MVQIIIVLVAALLLFVVFHYRDKVARFVLPQMRRKAENKKKLLSFLKERRTVTNKEIQEFLGVSARTVVNYMDELEEEGVVEQVGKTGKYTHYRLKT